MICRISRFVILAMCALGVRPAAAAVTVDVTTSTDRTTGATTIASPPFSTAASNELLLAFVATDAVGGPVTVNAVSGGGLTWVLVVRANTEMGTSEIWRAFAPSVLAGVTVTATTSQSVVSSIVVTSFTGADPSGTNGSGAIGAVAARSAASGAPTASLVTTRNGSWVFGVGNDYDDAIARTPGASQSIVHQSLTALGDTYWMQKQNAPTPAAGTTVTINDTAPAADRYNLSVCEILPAAASSTFRLSGTISPAAGGSGATVTLAGALLTTIADSSGNYTFTGVPNGSYTVTPTRSGYTFLPASQATTISGADVSGVNFTAQAAAAWSISGTISPPAGGGGGTVTLSGAASASTVADPSGNYTFGGVVDGSYTVTPGKTGYAFTPASKPVTVNGAAVAGINFTANSTTGQSVAGEWGAPFELGIVAVNAVMMHTSKVLLFSGAFVGSWAERVWDPATGALTLVPNLNYDLFCAGQAQLPDGRILVAGGFDTASLGAANANIFDPVTQAWSVLPNMAYRRWYPTVTTLPDGRMLVTSGGQTCLTCLADIPEIFDPATNRFSKMTTARLAVPYYPFMFVLPNGTVVDAGANEETFPTHALNITTSTWSSVDSVVRDGHSAAMYLPGKILKSGTAADSGTAGNAAPTAFVLDMTQPTPSWRQVASMANSRAFHNSTLLPDGTVLVTGGGTTLDGHNTGKAVYSAELWNPATETWQTLASASIPRLYHSTALLLPDGRVLSAGGGNDTGATDETQGQLFSPPYLFKGTRPTMTSVPGTVQYGAPFTVQTADAATIASVALMRPGSVTHSFDEDQRFVPLTFTAQGGSLTIQAPANANMAPPGYYMLFIVNGAGVPSVASFVRFAVPSGDTTPPTPPGSLAAQGSLGAASLTWTGSTDDTGVALYNVHRSTVSGFQPSAANKVGQSTSTAFSDTAAAGTYFYLVTAQDIAQNVSTPSNEAMAIVLIDITPPIVTITAPADLATVSNSVSLAATASDDVGIAGVQFQLDGAPLGAERTASPYAMTWNTATASNGGHIVGAVARDAAGNGATATVSVTASNTS